MPGPIRIHTSRLDYRDNEPHTFTTFLFWVRSEGLTAVTVKITVFCDMTPCSLPDHYQRFGGTCCIHLLPCRMERSCRTQFCVHVFIVVVAVSIDSYYGTACISVGFGVLIAVLMNSSICWDIPPCSPLKFNHFFAGTFHSHLQSSRVSQAKNHHKAGSICLVPAS
jgi:hypothetical protein